MNKILKLSVLSVAIIGIGGLAGCGGGGGSSTGIGSQLTGGTITGFGSVFVDGVEFETAGSSFSLDDLPGNEDNLEIGMVVTITGSVNPDGITGTASHIEYDDELEGIVLSSSIGPDETGSLDIMGQTVHVDATTIFESEVIGITGADQIVAGNIVEVSGYSSGDGTIFASRIEVKSAAHSGEEIEVKGIIGNLTANTFNIGNQAIDFSGATLNDIPGGELTEGLYVEVKSIAGFDGINQLIASEVELEDDGDMGLDGDEGGEAELNGIVTSVLSAEEFEIGGQTVLITGTTSYEHGDPVDIDIGVELEVEGHFNETGALVAEEIEFEEASNIEMEGMLEDISGTGANGSVTLFGQPVAVNSSTILIDEQDEDGLVPVHFFDLDDLMTGEYIEIDAHRDPDSGILIADKLERDDHRSTAAEIEGPVEDIPDADHLVIAGVRVNVSGVPVASNAVGDELEVSGSYDVGSGIFTATGIGVDD